MIALTLKIKKTMMSHVDGLQLELLKDTAVHDNDLQFLPALSTAKQE
jgi:hypothetical protein